MDKNKVKITMEDGGEIVVVLDEKTRPFRWENFRALVERRFYDGLIFHRVIDGFMIQGETPREQAAAAPKKYKGRVLRQRRKKQSRTDAESSPWRAQTISIRRQVNFFICHKDATFLDGQYAAFGVAESGLDVVDRIAAVPTDANDRPKKEQKIKSVRFAD